MSQSVLYMSMSLDGFITGPDDDADHGLGVNGERLHDWLHDTSSDEGPVNFRPTGANGQVFDEHLGSDHIELERVRVVEGERGVTHLRYRVVAA